MFLHRRSCDATQSLRSHPRRKPSPIQLATECRKEIRITAFTLSRTQPRRNLPFKPRLPILCFLCVNPHSSPPHTTPASRYCGNAGSFLTCLCARDKPECPPRISSPDLRALEWLNFFLADVQTGLGPFLAAYLSTSGWNPARVGYALTLQGMVTVGFQTPAGAIVDAARRKRVPVIVGLGLLTAGALLLFVRSNAGMVYTSGFLIGLAGPLLGPTLAAITLGLVSGDRFDTQFARIQGFNSAGNVVSALLIGLIGYHFGYRAVFLTAAFSRFPVSSHFRESTRQKSTMPAHAAPRPIIIRSPRGGYGSLWRIASCWHFL
jgi:Major Facilitator Superfamily